MAKILAVDDEAQILIALGRGLSRAGHEVVTARTAHDGLSAVASASPDLVLLDLGLPDLDGIDVVRRLRAWTLVPVLLLSGDGVVGRRVAALDAGADDVIDKPFSMEELRARVGAALRRSPPGVDASLGAQLRWGNLSIDLAARQVAASGQLVRLTPTQWRLLEALVSHPGKLVTYRQIIAQVWSEQHGDEARGSLRVHLRSLRAKLGDDASAPRYIETVPAVGCRWIDDATS